MIRATVLGALTLVIAACQGQGGLKRQTNPTSEYSDSLRGARAWKPGIKRLEPKQADNTQAFCQGNAFQVNVAGDIGNKLVELTAGQRADVEIDVVPQSDLAANFSAKAGQLPKGATFESRGGKYHLSWTPPVGSQKTNVLRIDFTAPGLQERCGTSQYSQMVNLIVGMDSRDPNVSVSGIPQATQNFGDAFNFKVEMIDPAGTDEQPPKISVSANPKKIKTGESQGVPAASAVDCLHDRPTRQGQTWIFSCKFTSNLIDNPPLYSGLKRAVFYVMGESTATKRRTAKEDGFAVSVPVNFPKKEEPVVAQAPAKVIEAGTRGITPPVAEMSSATDKLVNRPIDLINGKPPVPPARPDAKALGAVK